MKILNAIILPTLDYGCIIYDSASKNNIQTFNSILNTGIRFNWRFRISPCESLLSETGFKPFIQMDQNQNKKQDLEYTQVIIQKKYNMSNIHSILVQNCK